MIDGYPDVQERIRVIDVPLDSVPQLEIAGVQIRAIRAPHSRYMEQDEETGESIDRHRNVEHLEYVFTIAGQVIYHSGDADLNDILRYESYGFGKRPISLAFVTWWSEHERLTFRQTLVRDVIRPERIILMHMAPLHPPKGHPERQQTVAREVYLPRYPMEQWTFSIKAEATTP